MCFPGGGRASVLYFRRVGLSVGAASARSRAFARQGMDWRRIWSAGGDLLFDINLFRQPAAATTTVALSFYRPSSGGMWFTASLGLPF